MARSELLSLIDACKDDPGDAPRLVLADWLEEHGGEADRARAEFVRLQLARGDGPESPREAELLRDHARAWLGPLYPLRLDARASVCFQRGLVALTCRSAQVADASADAEALAWVHCLTLKDVTTAPARRLRASALLGGVIDLRLNGSLAAESFAALCRWPLGRLRRLDLREARLPPGSLESLSDCEQLAELAYLAPSLSGTTEAGVRALASGRHLVNLRELILSCCHLGPASAEALGASRALAGLRTLEVYNNAFGPEGIAALAAGTMDRLEQLQATQTAPGREGAEAIATSPVLANLRLLHLNGNRLGNPGVTALARSPHLRSLRTLGLTDTGVGVGGVRELAASPLLASVEYLALGGNRVGPGGARALAEADLSALRTLYLFSNRVGPNGAEALAASATLGGVRRLDLSHNALGDAGAVALAGSRLAALEVLTLDGNAIGDAGAVALAESPALANLRRLRLAGNAIGPAGRDALAGRFGASVVTV